MLLFELLDIDNESIGIIESNCPENKIKSLYKEYLSEELDLPQGELDQIGYPEDISADGFAALIRLNGFHAERKFLNQITE